MQRRQYTCIGSEKTVVEQLNVFTEETGVDEIMFSASTFDNEARK
ncbi:hypothetical protein [Lysinibacillus sp. LZ02]